MSREPITKILFEGGPMDGADKAAVLPMDLVRAADYTLRVCIQTGLPLPDRPVFHLYKLTTSTEGLGVFTWQGIDHQHFKS